MAAMSLTSTTNPRHLAFTHRTPQISSKSSSCRLSLPSLPAVNHSLVAGTRRGARLQQLVVVREDGDKASANSVQTSSAPFSLPNLPDWAKFLLGSLVWLTLPAWKKLQNLGDTLKKMDAVVETLEDYAEKADEIAEDLAADLPDGQLKKVVLQVEQTSEMVVSRAKLLDNFLDKVTGILDDLKGAAKKEGTDAVKKVEAETTKESKEA